mmetsp:Transcript_29285/g.64156  ORF Transcript_29285/g.64156 Transcript_29285/m.64156 type:complete len:219 (+) Transcript_29285:78-734(+)
MARVCTLQKTTQLTACSSGGNGGGDGGGGGGEGRGGSDGGGNGEGGSAGGANGEGTKSSTTETSLTPRGSKKASARSWLNDGSLTAVNSSSAGTFLAKTCTSYSYSHPGILRTGLRSSRRTTSKFLWPTPEGKFVRKYCRRSGAEAAEDPVVCAVADSEQKTTHWTIASLGGGAAGGKGGGCGEGGEGGGSDGGGGEGVGKDGGDDGGGGNGGGGTGG